MNIYIYKIWIYIYICFLFCSCVLFFFILHGFVAKGQARFHVVLSCAKPHCSLRPSATGGTNMLWTDPRGFESAYHRPLSTGDPTDGQHPPGP